MRRTTLILYIDLVLTSIRHMVEEHLIETINTQASEFQGFKFSTSNYAANQITKIVNFTYTAASKYKMGQDFNKPEINLCRVVE